MEISKNLSITSPKGFLASGVHCGIKKSNLDLALIYSEVLCSAAGTYTQNKVKGAPLYVTKEHLNNNKAKAIIINSGNANTCNGETGLINAREMTKLQGKELDIDYTDVLVASTGVIGVPLNINAIKNAIPDLTKKLSKLGDNNAAKAITTTDTFEKKMGITFKIQNKTITIGSIAKGSGMIEPNMGTMLSFLTTDINISPSLLNEALKESIKISYNRVSVDGDTSTNDMVLILANGLANNDEIKEKNSDYYIFLEALNKLNIELSKLIARDGEGATKLIECIVTGAASSTDAEVLSKSVINSSLVKTAIFGSDANWGRILCALGYANIPINPNTIDIAFKSNAGEIMVCKDGAALSFNEDKAKAILLPKDITILIDLNTGSFSSVAWGCDLSYEYVRINGDYRS